MDEEIDRLVISVRADTQGFARDMSDMRQGLEGVLGGGAERAGRAIETALLRAVRTGKLGFEDLRSVALSVMNSIARSALSSGLSALGGGGSGGGLLGSLATIGMAALGVPGRATGGPVSPGRAYRVGENGPELFVPTSSGQVVAAGGMGGARDVRVSITVAAPENSAPQALARSSRQIARNVRNALSQ
ncbi:MAG: tail tape measure protein [Sphingomonadales bacterium]|nr:MAG: tail tape measure protein [Sphingomonadales bacterium]TNF02463.1 MAG: tail tape measure protein [Sphingomonadales bacterium]